MNARMFKKVGLIALTASALTACGGGTSVESDTMNNSASTPGTAPLTDVADSNETIAPTAAPMCVATYAAVGGYKGSVATQVTDPDSNVLNFEVVEEPTFGSVVMDYNSGEFTYQPSIAEQGYSDQFKFRVHDLDGGSAVGKVEIIYGALRIMPLGDSITFGVTGYTGATGDLPKEEFAVGYRQELYDGLVEDGYLVDFVGSFQAGSAAGLVDPDHQGKPGWTTWQIGDQINGWLGENPSDVVLAHIGTNDHKETTDGVNFVLNNINNWSANNQDVKVLLAQIVDQRPDTFFADTVEGFNSNLAALVDASWPAVDVVDHYSVVDNTLDLTPLSQDSVGLHPNTSGYEKMASVWRNALEKSGKLHKCD